jgi:hypothetical protein
MNGSEESCHPQDVIYVTVPAPPFRKYNRPARISKSTAIAHTAGGGPVR